MADRVKVPFPFVTEANVKNFFFEGASLAWAGGGEYRPMPGMPRYKVFEYSDTSGVFVLKDWYFTIPGSRQSGGGTAIWVLGTPVWQMAFGGWYDEEAVPVVKEALLSAYARKQFNGGRGPTKFEKNGVAYWNYSSTKETPFSFFQGHEAAYACGVTKDTR